MYPYSNYPIGIGGSTRPWGQLILLFKPFLKLVLPRVGIKKLCSSTDALNCSLPRPDINTAHQKNEMNETIRNAGPKQNEVVHLQFSVDVKRLPFGPFELDLLLQRFTQLIVGQLLTVIGSIVADVAPL